MLTRRRALIRLGILLCVLVLVATAIVVLVAIVHTSHTTSTTIVPAITAGTLVGLFMLLLTFVPSLIIRTLKG